MTVTSSIVYPDHISFTIPERYPKFLEVAIIEVLEYIEANLALGEHRRLFRSDRAGPLPVRPRPDRAATDRTGRTAGPRRPAARS